MTIRSSPDIHSDQIFPVLLLDCVVYGVSACKCDVDVASGDDICFVVTDRVGEHDVSIIRCLGELKQK